MGTTITTPVNVATIPKPTVPNNAVFVVGQNVNDPHHYIKTLMTSNINTNMANVTDIQSGYGFTIYYDANHQICVMSGPASLVSSMNHFKIYDIKINKVFTSVSDPNSVIFCTSKNEPIAYGCSMNIAQSKCKLGISVDAHVTHGKPSLIRHLSTDHKHIVDIRTARYYSVALCSYSNYGNIVTFWSRRCTKHCRSICIPKEIVNIILLFYNLNKIYSTGFPRYGGHCDSKSKKRHWSEINFFNDHNVRIIKISTGSYHTLCLDSKGNIWSAGNNDYGQLGVGHFKTNAAAYPKSIKYFVRYKIKIKQIRSGHSHNLAIDFHKRLYAWGNSEHGQTGHGSVKNINKPKLIEVFKKRQYKITKIECGTWHSCACNDKNEYFLWGSNDFSECLVSHNEKKIIATPHYINDIVKEETNCKYIKEISLGNRNTKLIVTLG